MIQHIRTKGFKGFDIDEDIPKKIIYAGPNAKGKSARAGAIAIALYGHIPFSTAGKRPSDILDSFGDDSLVCSVTINGQEFARKFARTAKGGVTQSFQIDKKKASAQNFAIALDRAGSPKIADVAEFMKQSEAKKVDTLFELYPNPELAEIDDKIEKAKADVFHWQKKKEGAEATVQTLINSKQTLQLPAGTVAEIQAEIKQVEDQIADLENQIKQAEIAEAEEKARVEGARQEKERAEQEAAQKKADELQLKTEEDWQAAGIDSMPDSPEMAEADQVISRMENGPRFNRERTEIDGNAFLHDQQIEPFEPNLKDYAAGSIQKIIDAMRETGCSACAAMIVAKQELKKYE